MQHDYAIIGGGVVGLSIAYGLMRLGHRVLVLDEGDMGLRASRGNFGLVWVQTKGLNAPGYAMWSRRSAELWQDFAAELTGTTSNAMGLQQDGGYDFHLSETDLDAKIAQHTALRDALGGDHPFEVIGHNTLRREEPHIGSRVVGAIYGPKDGHVNPLRLLKTLAERNTEQGVRLKTGYHVNTIDPISTGGYRIRASQEIFEAEKVVLCAGLGSATLGPQLGLDANIRPQRGQVMITEKIAPLLNRPSTFIRQVDEGGIQIGDTKEEVGFNDSVALETLSFLSQRAATVFPALANARIVRTWAALRVMSADGLPIYQHSRSHPGAYLVTCHSGVTLAAAHARLVPLWLDAQPGAPDLEGQSTHRFANRMLN